MDEIVDEYGGAFVGLIFMAVVINVLLQVLFGILI